MDDRTLLSGTAEERILTCLKAAGWYKGNTAQPLCVRSRASSIKLS